MLRRFARPVCGLATAGLVGLSVGGLRCESAVERGVGASFDVEGVVEGVEGVEGAYSGVWGCARLCGRAGVLAAALCPSLFASLSCFGAYWLSGDRWWLTEGYLWVCEGINAAGCVAIKLAQWLSTREDMLPHELTVHLRELRESAPAHSGAVSEAELRRVLGQDGFSERLQLFEHTPMASGSVGQVHRAVFDSRAVAVKVRHPWVKRDLVADLLLLQWVSAACGWVAAAVADGIAPPVDLHSFATTLLPQTDFRIEANNLRKFRSQFEQSSTPVSFPEPIWACESVLIESLEAGVSIQRFVDANSPINAALASAGVDLFLSMLLRNNFVHADAHAGNIYVKHNAPPSSSSSTTSTTSTTTPTTTPTPTPSSTSSPPPRWLFLRRLFRLLPQSAPASAPASPPPHLSSPQKTHSLLTRFPPPWRGPPPLIEPSSLSFVVLDAGLVTEMPAQDVPRLHRLLAAIFLADASLAADQFLAMSRGCRDERAFRADMRLLFQGTIGSALQRRAANVGHLMREMLTLVAAHNMTLHVDFSSVVIAMGVLEGLARTLDPDIDLITRLAPFLVKQGLTVLGRSVAHVTNTAET